MSNETPARILKVTVEYGDEERAIRVPVDAGTPQSVTVALADGRYVRVNADGGLTFTATDGRTITVDGNGEIQAGARHAPSVSLRGKHDIDIRGPVQGFQAGDGNTQVNAW